MFTRQSVSLPEVAQKGLNCWALSSLLLAEKQAAESEYGDTPPLVESSDSFLAFSSLHNQPKGKDAPQKQPRRNGRKRSI